MIFSLKRNKSTKGKKNMMTIKIKVIGNRNPRKLDELKYYATTVSRGDTDLEMLSELVSDQTSMTKADCYGVLIALEHNIIQELKNGNIVRLGSLGSYQISVSSDGTLHKKDFKAKNIKKARILFRPGKGLKNMLKYLKYEF